MVRALACLLGVALVCGAASADEKKPKDNNKAKNTKKSSGKKNNDEKGKDHKPTEKGHPNPSVSPAVKLRQLREEVDLLRHHQNTTLHAIDERSIDERYKRIIARLDAPEDQLRRERSRLRHEERVALENIPPGPERELVRNQYNKLIAMLNGDLRHDNHRMDHLRHIRDSEKGHVRTAFAVKIGPLEQEIHALEHSGKGKK